MKCNNCGQELGVNDVFCTNCGTQVQRNTKIDENSYTYERNTNQQMNYQQQNSGQNRVNNYEQTHQKSKNTGGIFKVWMGILIGISIFVAIGFIICLGVNALTNNKKTDIAIQDKTTNSLVNEDKNSGLVNPVSNNKTSTYKVNYSGFKLYIPDDLKYEIGYSTEAMMIGDSEQTWAIGLMIEKGSFQKLKKNRNQLIPVLEQQFNVDNVRISNPTVETIGGVEFILLECEVEGQRVLMGYASLNSMYTACFSIVNEDNEFNRECLMDLATIIKTAEYTGDSQYLKTDEKIKMEPIHKAFEKIIETDGE